MLKSATKSALSLAALGAVLVLAHVTMASAAPTKVWVSNAGSDSPACGEVSTPCRSFQQAHDNVAAGGEVGILTPGDYFTLSIGKSVHIRNDGVGEASILAAGRTGIELNAGFGDTVGLRGLTIDGQGTGNRGLEIRQAAGVHVQNCVIANFELSGDGFGITMFPGRTVQVFISDTLIYNNGSVASSGGLWIQPGGILANLNIVLDHVRLENNVRAVWVDSTIGGNGNGAHVVIRDSVVSGNAGEGIFASTVAGQAPAFVVVEHTSLLNNGGTGILANGPRATIILNDDTVTRNGVGISAVNSGQVISFGNNKNFNNVGPEGAPTGFFSQM